MKAKELLEWLSAMIECGQLTGEEEVALLSEYTDPDGTPTTNYIDNMTIDTEDKVVILHGL